jgi:hypothetical protein
MKELFENEDEFLGLVRKQGLLRPSADFTSRVMQSIEQIREPSVYKPLLSKTAWSVITGGFFLTVILCWYFFSGTKSDSRINLSGSIDQIRGYVGNINLSFQFDANALLIITLAIVSMGILIILDFWLSNNRKEDAV